MEDIKENTADEIKEIEIIITTIRRVLNKKNIKLDENVYTLDGRQYLAIENINYNYIDMRNAIEQIRDKAECMDYYCLNDVIDDLNKLLGDE